MRKRSISPLEHEVIRERYEHYNIPPVVVRLIEEAIHSLNQGKWVYDGTTLDVELAPNSIEESSLVHDYLWIMGWGGWLSNILYVRMLKLYQSSKPTRWYRMVGITVGWYLLYFPYYIWKRNYRPIPKQMKECLSLLRPSWQNRVLGTLKKKEQ